MFSLITSPHIYLSCEAHSITKKKKKYKLLLVFCINVFDSLRCLSIMDISHLKDHVNNYIHFLSGSFISNEAASSQRESMKSLLNDTNRDYIYVKRSVHLDKDWEHR